MDVPFQRKFNLKSTNLLKHKGLIFKVVMECVKYSFVSSYEGQIFIKLTSLKLTGQILSPNLV